MDLELVQTSRLIEELMSRYEHAVFIGSACNREYKDGTTDVQVRRRWKGSSFTVAGLCTDGARVVLNDFGARCSEPSEGDVV